MNNKVLWNHEMNFAIGLATEMDVEEFEIAALEAHLDLTGEGLCNDEYVISEDVELLRLELI
ncbi:hypothetical protein EZV73_26710 [Acidaminobacter sp. JC074]|uniref:hypothetical protein n=1 Tax=Acidaminobacter sp. JC074 TaxID=2530199 RepID=UPI001F0E4695|nr:hypothetical protein [Acidaminobacter sp. JC074]MCH4891199.1 hypothetical protein [Acidaminobacter sp. JC074]